MTNPVGRPTDYLPEYDEQAKKLCMLGATNEEIADFFGIATSTFYNWQNEHPNFLESIKKGKLIADAEVANKLFSRATGYSHSAVKIFNDQGKPLEVPYIEQYPPDTAAAIFWLKNRRPDMWKDKQELTGANGGAITVEIVRYGDTPTK